MYFRLRIAYNLLLFAGAVLADIQVSITSSSALAAPGDNVTFVCRVVDAGTGVLVYMHKQVESEGVVYNEAISTNDILTPLYTQLGRFEANVVDTGDATLFMLNVYGVTVQDTGYYGCYDARHQVGDVTPLEVYKQASAVSFVNHTFRDPYVFTEGVPQQVQCLVDDVVPVPYVRLYIGDNDYTTSFIKDTGKDVLCAGSESGKECPLYYNYDVKMKHVAFLPSYHEHGQMMICESNMQVPFTGMESVHARAPIIVYYSPKYLCEEEYDVTLSESYNVTCIITSYPLPSRMTWHFVIGYKSYQLESGTSQDDYQAIEHAISDTEASYTLVIERVEAEHLTTYALQTEQQLTNSSFNLSLTQQIVTTESTDGATSVRIINTYGLLCLLFLLLCLS